MSLLIAALLVGTWGLKASAAERASTRSAVPFVSGGVGEEALVRLKARENEFNLKLVFTLVEGNYLADVGVSIADASGKPLVEHVTDGPIFMARLPAGTYTVTARYSGTAQSRNVSVRAARLHTEYLRWPSNPQTDFPAQPERRSAAPETRLAQATSESPVRGSALVISGGIGEESRAQLKAREHEYNLKLMFTLTEGNYLADVRVAVRDAGGQVVAEHMAEGPFLLARLPPGSYTVAATYGGWPQTRSIRVGERLQTVHFQWRSEATADVPGPRDRER